MLECALQALYGGDIGESKKMRELYVIASYSILVRISISRRAGVAMRDVRVIHHRGNLKTVIFNFLV